MGIKALWKWLENKHSDLFEYISAHEFKGQRIGVDGPAWWTSWRIVARGAICKKTDIVNDDPDEGEIDRLWIDLLVKELIKWRQLGIHPVICTDGKPHFLKDECRRDRKATTVSSQNKIAELRLKLQAVPKSELIKYRKEIDCLRRLVVNLPYVTHESKALFLTFAGKIGFPVIDGADTVEAEGLASSLNAYGYAAATYSADGDCLAHGASLLIKESATGNDGIPVFRCIYLHKVLDALKMEYTQFIDLCIMAGCDYNNNIPNIGIAKAFQMLTSCSSLDNITIDTSCLHYHECRELFMLRPPAQLLATTSKQVIDLQPADVQSTIYELQWYNLGGFATDLIKLTHNVVTPTNCNIVSYRGCMINTLQFRKQEPKYENGQINI
jgi:5'-3' exonuclease